MIPTSVHGTLDYVASGVYLAFPTLLELDDSPAAALIPRLDGIVGAGYGLITDYEFGLLKVLLMPTHLIFDAAKEALLASSPCCSASQEKDHATGYRTCLWALQTYWLR